MRRLLAALPLMLAACGGDPAPPMNPSPIAPLSLSVRHLVVEVDYAPGAAPFTGGGGTMTNVRNLWQEIFAANVRRLFRGAAVTLEVPDALEAMEALPPVGGPDFTADEILAIARAHRERWSEGDTAAYYVVFLDGYLLDQGRRRADVLGASLGASGVIAMFKPVITSLAASGPLAKYVEQSTLIHEFGHAIGLVDNGIPMVAPHRDSAHGAHCDGEACVMNYLNEGPEGLQRLARRFNDGDPSTNSFIIFDDACLADLAAAIASARR